MRGIRLLIKNAFRSAAKSIYQIIGLSMLILLVSLILSLLFSTSSAIFNANQRLTTQSNLRSDVVEIDNSKIHIDTNDINQLSTLNSTAQDVYQQAIIDEVVGGPENIKKTISWTRTEGRTFNEVYNGSKKLLVKAITKFGDGVVLANEPTIDSSTVDKLVITDGVGLSSDSKTASHEAVIQKNFAEKNKINIGDIIRFNKDSFGENNVQDGSQFVVTSDETIKQNLEKELVGKSWAENYEKTEYANANWFQIVGFGTSADFAAPIIDRTTTLPNINKDVLVYVAPQVFGFTDFTKINGNDNNTQQTTWGSIINYDPAKAILTITSDSDREVYFSLKAKDGNKISSIVDLQKKFNELAGITTDSKIIYANDDSNYQFYSRVHIFISVSTVFTIVSTILLLVVGLIAATTIVLMTIKYVESIQKQIGCLKALGYKKREVVNNFIALPLITSALGCILGYTSSLGVGQGILIGFRQYFNVDFGGITFNVWSFLSSFVLTMIVMIMIAYSAAYLVIRRSPLKLLEGSAEHQSSKFARALKKLTLSKSFNGRLRGALIASSFGRLIGLTTTILASTILMSASVMAPKIMADNKVDNFLGLKYQNSVEYTKPLWNNPLSFFRTFNPEYDNTTAKSDGWGITPDKKFIKNMNMDYAGTKHNAVSPLPYTNDKNEPKIDTAKVLEDIIGGDISTQFYTFDKMVGNNGLFDSGAWAKFSYLNWKTLPMSYLKSLNTATLDSLISSTVISTMAEQWPDYRELIKNLKEMTKNSNDSASEPLDYFKVLNSFYVKYASGIPLYYSPSPDSPSPANSTDNFEAMKKAITELIPDNIIDKEYYGNLDIDDNTKTVFTFHNAENSEVINMSRVNPDDFSNGLYPNDLKALNTELARWLYGAIYMRLGTILLETSYSRAPYFVQQKIKDALINDTEYSLTFNVTPYNKKVDDLGTMIEGTFDQKNGDNTALKIYGLKEDQKTINLGVDYNKLISGDKNVTPIIINKTVAKKAGIKVGNSLDLSYLREELSAKTDNGDRIAQLTDEDGFTPESGDDEPKIVTNKSHDPISNASLTNYKINEYMPESAANYYATTGSYVSGLTGSNTPAYIGGAAIAGTDSTTATNVQNSSLLVSAGKIKINRTNVNHKFKVVGIQPSYGNAQAWISDDNAKHLLKYDIAENYIFKNFFIPQYKGWNKNDEFKDLDIAYDLTKIANLSDADALNTLKKDALANTAGAKNILQLFNNLYPIFNYKNSLDAKTYDIDQAVITDQRYGDAGAVGLNGGYRYAPDDSDHSTPIKYYIGYGQGGTSLIYPITEARQILSQITTIVNMVIILFLVIAFLVSITMILLTTSLIIRENTQFIATMKVLGYSNGYIVRQILGMYIGGIVVAFTIGFILSWFGIVGLGSALAQNSTWVLPINFYIWYPFAVLGLLVSIYASTTAASFANVQRINPLHALQFEK